MDITLSADTLAVLAQMQGRSDIRTRYIVVNRQGGLVDRNAHGKAVRWCFAKLELAHHAAALADGAVFDYRTGTFL